MIDKYRDFRGNGNQRNALQVSFPKGMQLFRHIL